MPSAPLYLHNFLHEKERVNVLNGQRKSDFLIKIKVKYENYIGYWRAPDHDTDWNPITFTNDYFLQDFALAYGPNNFLTKFEGVATFFLPLRTVNASLFKMPLIYILSDKNVLTDIHDLSTSSITRQMNAEIYVNTSKLTAYKNLHNFKILSAQVKSKEVRLKLKDCINIPDDPNFNLFTNLHRNSAVNQNNSYYSEGGIIMDRYRGARYNPAEDNANSRENFVAVSGMLRMFGDVRHFERDEGRLLSRTELRPLYRARYIHLH